MSRQSLRQLQRSLAELIKAGLIAVSPQFAPGGGQTSNAYLIKLDHTPRVQQTPPTSIGRAPLAQQTCPPRLLDAPPTSVGRTINKSINKSIEQDNEQSARGARDRKRKQADQLPPIPAALDTAEFRAAWAAWLDHRREMGHPATPQAAKLVLRDCERWGVARSIANIEAAIRNSWRGVFDRGADAPRGNGRASGGLASRPPAADLDFQF